MEMPTGSLPIACKKGDLMLSWSEGMLNGNIMAVKVRLSEKGTVGAMLWKEVVE
jgi:hypothetical protein